MLTLSAMTGGYPYVLPALDNNHLDPDIYLRSADISGTVVEGFRMMARDLAFDVSELGLSTALCAREYDVPFTAIPVFLTRRFDHGGMFIHRDAGISEPGDLKGKSVGVRSYSVTDNVWVCGLLFDTYGVHPEDIHWVVTGDEHVASTVLPANAEAKTGANLVQLFESREIDAVFGPRAPDSPSVEPLLANAPEAERSWAKDKGYLPMHHTVVVKDELLRAHPELASELYKIFSSAKSESLRDKPDQLAGTRTEHHTFEELSSLVGKDTFPYGIERNRRALDDFCRYAKMMSLIGDSRELSDFFVDVGE